MAKTEKELNPKQKRFCTEYIIDSNGTQAAIRAGYSKKTAQAIAAENLTKPLISAEIEKLRKEQEERTLVTADFVILGLKEVAERCLQRKPVMVFDYKEKELVQKTVEVDDKEGSGTHEEGVWEFDSQGANKALELLGKHLDLFKGNDNQPVKVVVEIKQVP